MSRRGHVRESSNPTRDLMVKVALQVSLSIAKAFLHTPSRNFIRELAQSGIVPGLKEVHDNATIAESLLGQLSQSLADGDMTDEDRLMLTEALVSVLDLLTTFTKPMLQIPSHELFLSFKAYILMHQLCAPPLYGDYPDTRQPNHKEVVALRRYMRFSMSSYGMKGLRLLGFFPLLRKAVWSNDQAIQYLTGLDPSKALVAHRWRTRVVGELYQPGFLLLVDKAHREVVVCIRGSYRLNDVLTDLMCDSVPFDLSSVETTVDPADLSKLRRTSSEMDDSFENADDAMFDEPVETGDGDNDDEGSIDDEAILRSLGFEEDPEHIPELREVVSKLGDALSELASSNPLQYPVAVHESQASHPEHDESLEDEGPSHSQEFSQYVSKWVGAQQKTIARALFQSAKSLGRVSQRRLRDENLEATRLRKESRIHKGFLKSAKALGDELLGPVIETLESNPGYRLVLCGHSLGGAVAATLALLWRERPEKQFEEMRCYTYAPPCAVSYKLAVAPATKRLIRSVIFGQDIIPHLSIAGCRDVRDAVLRLATTPAPAKEGDPFPVFDDTRSINGAAGSIGEETEEDEEESQLLCEYVLEHIQRYRNEVANMAEKCPERDVATAKVRKILDPVLNQLREVDMSKREKLYPPGTLWHVDPSFPHGIHGGAFLAPNKAFGEINLNMKMAAHHLQQKYAHACDPSLPLRPKVPGDVDLL